MTDRGSPAAVGTTFALAGLISASSLSRMPSVRAQVGASSAELSLALVFSGVGAVVAMPFTGRLTERFSSAVVFRVFVAVVAAAWVVVAHTGSVAALAPCLFLTGVGFGVSDVAMNVQGHAVEQRHGRVIMPRWHALFSFGSVLGAGIGALAAKLGIGIAWQYPVVNAGVLAAAWWATRHYAPDAVTHGAERTVSPSTGEVLPETAELSASALDVRAAAQPRRGLTRLEILLGLMVLATALGEGAANDWLGLMLVDTRGVPEAFGAVTLAGFNVTMGIGRLLGAGAIERWGRATVLRISGITAAGGVLLLCLVDNPVSALIGAGGWGLGLAVVFPSGMSAAGEIPGRGPRAIAAVSTIGYGGFLLGAPSIGQLTHAVPLDRALLVVAGMAVLIALLAPSARERGRAAAAALPQA